MKKNIELSIEQARKLLGKDPAMDVLIKANFTEEELNPKQKMGYYISHFGTIEQCIDYDGVNKNIVFPYKSQAEGVLAMSQLAQKMAEVNGSWKPDWADEAETKWCIELKFDDKSWVRCLRGWANPKFLAFQTEEIRDKFLEENLELIKEYGKIFRCK